MTVPAALAAPTGPEPTPSEVEAVDGDDVGSARPVRPLAIAVALVAWAGIIVAAWRVGLPNRAVWRLRAAPLFGDVDPQLAPAALAALVAGLVGAWALPRWTARVRWTALVVATPALGLAWGLLLSAARPAGLERGLDSRFEYPAVIGDIERLGLHRFVSTFADERVLAGYPIHVQGHPVGAPLAYWALDAVGLGGPRWAALATVLVGASTWAAVLLVVRTVASERAARALAPFLVLVPAVVWMVTSADAAFAAVAAWATALLVLATRPEQSPTRTAVLAVAGGALWGVGLLCSYGLAPVGLVPVAVVVARRRWAVLAWGAAGGAAVLGASAAAGFWWLDGLAATHERYWDGVAALRPRPYFTLLSNPAALAVALGPAVAVALAVVRDRRLWLLGGAGLAAVAVASASGLSKGEVERIWLPFVPWILVLAGGLALRVPRLVPVLLAAQVLVAVAVESLVSTPW